MIAKLLPHAVIPPLLKLLDADMIDFMRALLSRDFRATGITISSEWSAACERLFEIGCLDLVADRWCVNHNGSQLLALWKAQQPADPNASPVIDMEWFAPPC
jgi:hypothetical protein